MYIKHRKQLVLQSILIVFIFLVASANAVTITAASPHSAHYSTLRSYTTGSGQITITHNTGDEGMYYGTPSNEIAYNTQIIKLGLNNYKTVYHSEPNKSNNCSPTCFPGDSIKVGSYNSPWYFMPANKAFKIWGTATDSLSSLYSTRTTNAYSAYSGGANPMVVAGRYWVGDNYYYMFFLAVADDDLDHQTGENDYRHWLVQARTLDFVNFDLKTEINGVQTWRPFTTSAPYYERRPRTLQDSNGLTVMSNTPAHPDYTKGLIGSIVIHNGTYYYFYTDFAPNSSTEAHLYYRTAVDITKNNYWSPPTQVTTSHLPSADIIIRVAKAKGMNRWAVLYNCIQPMVSSSASPRPDLCLQYTENLNVTGSGGISSIDFFQGDYDARESDYFLGLVSGGADSFAQHYWMTDKDGNLVSPDGEDQSCRRGGIITWSDFQHDGNPYNVDVYGGDVYRAGWDVSGPGCP